MCFGILCRQEPACPNYAAYRFTWPGQDESFICDAHASKLRRVAQAMGMYIQLIPLAASDHGGSEGMKSAEEQRSQ